MNRIVEPEFLDELSPDDPRAVRSRRDLRRINAWMTNAGIMAKALKKHCPYLTERGRPARELSGNEHAGGPPALLIELGAGDGRFLFNVAKKTGWPNTRAILLDSQKIVSAETLAAFSKTGWSAETVTADVFDWAETPERRHPAGVPETIVANLFLHHFEDDKLAALLQKISERAALFVAIEPRRVPHVSWCGRLLWLIGCSDVTRHDAAVSIRAGFSSAEISALWPDKKNWQLTERRAGFFSHLFIAKRLE